MSHLTRIKMKSNDQVRYVFPFVGLDLLHATSFPSGSFLNRVSQRSSSMRTTSIVSTLLAISFTGAASASVAGLQGLYAKNYIVEAGGTSYSVMDVYVKFNTSNGTGSAGERIVSCFGVTTTSSSTYGVDQKAKYVNSAGLAFQHSNTGWTPGSTAGGGTGNNSWDSFVTLGCRTQGATNTGGVSADPYFANPNGPDVSSIVGAPNGTGGYPGAGWSQNNPLDSLFETNASANADKLIMIGRFTLKCSDIVALGAGAAPKMVMWLQATGKSTAQTGGTTLYTISGANLRSDSQTKLTGSLVSNKIFTFDPTFDGVDSSQAAWTFAPGPLPSPGVAALIGIAGAFFGKRRRS